MADIVKIIIKAVDEFSKTFKDAEGQVGSLMGTIEKNKGMLLGLGGAITAAGVGGALALTSFAKKAGEAGDITEAFNKIVGKEGPDMLKKMQDATLGTKNEFELMAAANDAVNKGISKDSIPIFTDFAMRMKDMGKTNAEVTDILTSMTTAIATGRTITLESMGITLEADKIYTDYAKKLGLTSGKTEEIATEEAKKAQSTIEGLEATKKSLDLKIREIQLSDNSAEEKAKETGKYREQILEIDKTIFGLESLTKQTQAVYKEDENLGKLLDENQKRMAMEEAALGQIIEKMKTLPQPTVDVADQLDQLNAKWFTMQVAIGNAAAPAIGWIIEKLQILMGWFQQLSPETQKWIGIIAMIGTIGALVIGPLLILIALLPTLIAGFGLVLGGIIAILPILAMIVAGVAAVIAAFYATRIIKDIVIEVWDFIKEKTKTVTDEVIRFINSIIAAISRIWEAVKGIPSKVKERVGSIVGTARRAVGLQEGGIVTRPTMAMIGEAGPEAIIPLAKTTGGRKNKNIGNVSNITINIDKVQGLSADAVADALQRKLRTLISI